MGTAVRKKITTKRLFIESASKGRLYFDHRGDSFDNHVQMQHGSNSIVVGSNASAFVAQMDRKAEIREYILSTADYQAANFFVRLVMMPVKIPAIVEFIFLFGMIISCINLMRNPTLHYLIFVKGLIDNYSSLYA